MRTAVYAIAAVIALAGLAEATYLTVESLTGQTAICGGSKSCVEVLSSPYAKIGGVPISGLGAAAYFGAFSFATFAAFGYLRAARLFAINVWTMFVVTLALLYIQAFVLRAFCRYCLLSAALTFLLAGIAVAAPRQDRQSLQKAKSRSA